VTTNPARNPNPAMYIRHGAKEARVEVVLDDGTRVAWVRTKRWAMYELWSPGAEEPEEYHKLQGKVPEVVSRVLRLDLVDLENGKDSVDIHIGNQREPIFLLNKPDSAMAAFFAASTESAHLLAMQNLLKRRTQDAKREERNLEAQFHRIFAEIDELSPLPDIELQMETVLELEKIAVTLESAVPVLESVLAEQRNLTVNVQKAAAAAKVLARASAPPKLNEISSLNGSIHSMALAERQLAAARKTRTVLASLAGLPETVDTGFLLRLVESIAAKGRVLRKAADQNAVLAGLADVPSREESKELADFLDEFIAVHYRHTRMSRWDKLLRKIAEPPTPEPVGALGAIVAELAVLEAGLSERKQTLDGLEKDLREIVDVMDKRIKEFGCCPTCGGDLTTATFLDHGCRHDA
jgi:exonuclease SbcC